MASPARAQIGAADFGDRITPLGGDWLGRCADDLPSGPAQPHGPRSAATLLRDLATYGRLQRLWREAGRTGGLRRKALFTYSLARARGAMPSFTAGPTNMRSYGPGDVALRHIGVIATYLAAHAAR